ncbi:TetR/AcrR family transcriptional regulator [Desulfothermus okinawensis JCM 13304]
MIKKDIANMHETAQIILEKAHDLFVEKGYERSSMREIAERVGISKAALYHHFKNKEEILFTLCVKAGEIINEDMRQAIFRSETQYANVRDQLINILYDYTTGYLRHKNFNKVLFFEIESLPPEKREIIVNYERSNVAQFKNYLRRIMDQGKIKKTNITVLTFCFFATVQWLYFWYKKDGSLSIKEIIEYIVDYFLYGIIGEEEK